MSQTIPMNRNWRGNLTTENAEQVAERMRRLLVGKKFTTVIANEFSGFKPEVEINQGLVTRRVESPISVLRDRDNKVATLAIDVPGAVWMLDTRLAKDEANQDGQNPYMFFEEDRVTITHCSDGGKKMYWLLVVQE